MVLHMKLYYNKISGAAFKWLRVYYFSFFFLWSFALTSRIRVLNSGGWLNDQRKEGKGHWGTEPQLFHLVLSCGLSSPMISTIPFLTGAQH